MQHYIHASEDTAPGTVVRTTGNTRRLIVIEEVGDEFRANSEDADVWGLDRGRRYRAALGRDATPEEAEAYEFARHPSRALWELVMRRGRPHQGGEKLHLENLSNDVFSGTANLHADGGQLVATTYTHIYDGQDIREEKSLPLSELPQAYAEHARALTERARQAAEQAAAEDDGLEYL